MQGNGGGESWGSFPQGDDAVGVVAAVGFDFGADGIFAIEDHGSGIELVGVVFDRIPRPCLMGVAHDLLAIDCQGDPFDFQPTGAGLIGESDFIVAFLLDRLGEVEGEFLAGRGDLIGLPATDFGETRRQLGEDIDEIRRKLFLIWRNVLYSMAYTSK